jgi:hypothetical protein
VGELCIFFARERRSGGTILTAFRLFFLWIGLPRAETPLSRRLRRRFLAALP